MTIDELKAKAKAMELNWAYFRCGIQHLVLAITGSILDEDAPIWRDTAATLLGALDPGAVVVKVGHACIDPMRQHECELSPYKCGLSVDRASETDPIKIPGPDCPGPAPDGHEWVLVLRRKR